MLCGLHQIFQSAKHVFRVKQLRIEQHGGEDTDNNILTALLVSTILPTASLYFSCSVHEPIYGDTATGTPY